MNLSDTRALVTASSRNLGAEVARTLAARGATVAVTYRGSRQAADDLVNELRERHGGKHVAVFADTQTTDRVSEMMDAVLGELGGLEILVNNSGPFSAVPFAEMSATEFDRVWNANVTATFLAVQHAVPSMRSAGWGRIINLSAVSASVRNRSIYGLAKSAIEILTEELALELAPSITVNAVSPGQIRESREEMADLNQEWARTATERTPLGRLVTRREVAELIALLCTPEFDMVTGATIHIDGGLRLPRF